MDFDAWLEKISNGIGGVYLLDVIGIKDHQVQGAGSWIFTMRESTCCFLETDMSVLSAGLAKAVGLLVQQGCANKVSSFFGGKNAEDL